MQKNVKTDIIKRFLKKPAMEALLVAALLFVGILIRFYHFGSIPVGVHQDEAMAAVDAAALAKYGTDRYGMRFPVHFTAWIGSQMSVLLSYCMVPFIKLLGFSTFSIRLPMLFISSFGLLALYCFARQVGGRFVAAVALALGIICPWHYMQSRWSFDCNAFPHVFLMGVCLLLAGRKRKSLLYLSMILFGLCSYCYGIANYSVPCFLLAMAIYLFRTGQVRFRELIWCFLAYFLVVLPEFLTMLINLMKWDTIETPFFTIPYFPRTIRARDILLTQFSWKQLWINIKCIFSVVWGNGDASVTNTIVRFGPTYYVTNVFFLIGLGVTIYRIRKIKDAGQKAPYVVLLAWLLMGIWVGIVTREVTINRINIIFYPVLMMAVLGIVWCIQRCRLLAAPIAVAYGLLALLFVREYFGGWTDLSRIYYYEPYINALYYAREIPCDRYYVTPDPQGQGVNMVGEILTMYCHEIDALYYQGVSNVQGGEEVLPYKERYLFKDVTEEVIAENKGQNVVYIVNGEGAALFSPEEYDICSFYDAYFVVSGK